MFWGIFSPSFARSRCASVNSHLCGIAANKSREGCASIAHAFREGGHQQSEDVEFGLYTYYAKIKCVNNFLRRRRFFSKTPKKRSANQQRLLKRRVLLHMKNVKHKECFNNLSERDWVK